MVFWTHANISLHDFSFFNCSDNCFHGYCRILIMKCLIPFSSIFLSYRFVSLCFCMRWKAENQEEFLIWPQVTDTLYHKKQYRVIWKLWKPATVISRFSLFKLWKHDIKTLKGGKTQKRNVSILCPYKTAPLLMCFCSSNTSGTKNRISKWCWKLTPA